MRLAMVVAVDEHFAIGKDGHLLWNLPNDMKRFKDITYGHHVLMGRKTYASIPARFRPLPGRANIVVSRTQQFEGCKSVATIDEAVSFAADCNERELMIIGGSEIYKQLFERTDTIYLTDRLCITPLMRMHFSQPLIGANGTSVMSSVSNKTKSMLTLILSST
jgi:dihydrofolate reductase